jgi:hypothetical protein
MDSEHGPNRVDKIVYQEVLRQYREWNRSELKRKIHEAGTKTSDQKWREYLAVMEFGMMIRPQPSRHEERQKTEMLNLYYRRIQKFEEWRRHGKSDQGIAP